MMQDQGQPYCAGMRWQASQTTAQCAQAAGKALHLVE